MRYTPRKPIFDHKILWYDKNYIYYRTDKETAKELDGTYIYARKAYRVYISLEAIQELEDTDFDIEKLIPLKNKLLEERKAGQSVKYTDKVNEIDKRLRPYQQVDVEFISRRTNAGVFNEQRTGKTPTTLISVRDDASIIIVCPAGLKLNWKNEIKTWLNRDDVYIIKGTPTSRRRLYRTWKKESTGIVIVSYETLRADIEWLESTMKFGRKVFTLVADEVHRLRNYRTKQSRALYKTRKYAKKVYALTGTPAVNHPADVFGILKLLRPDKFTSYWQFAERFFTVRDGYFAKEVAGIKEERREELANLLADISVNRKRKEVMQWIPKVMHKSIVLEFDTKQQKHYTKATREFLFGDNIEIPNPLALLTRLRQICADPALLDLEGESPKTKFIKEFLNDNTESIIIFSSFTSYLLTLHRSIEGSVLLTGQQTQAEKDRNIKAFQSGKARVLLANIKAGGVGFTLDKADTIIFTDRSYNPVDNDQAADRFIPTRKDKAYGAKQIIDLVMQNSVESGINKLLEKKQNIISYVNDYSEKGLVKLVQNEL